MSQFFSFLSSFFLPVDGAGFRLSFFPVEGGRRRPRDLREWFITEQWLIWKRENLDVNDGTLLLISVIIIIIIIITIFMIITTSANFLFITAMVKP